MWITTDVVLTESHMAALPTAPLDRIVKPLVVFFVDHKFYTLFSFLFGLGFAIQLSRAEQRGRGIAMTYARRVAILALIGGHRIEAYQHSCRQCQCERQYQQETHVPVLHQQQREAANRVDQQDVAVPDERNVRELFSGIGFGLYGEVGPALCVVISIAIFTAQMVFSRWWLAR